jgi:uncharacterized protein
MKIVDVNVLLYLVNRDALQHDRMRQWWEDLVNSGETIGLSWSVILGFLRLSTRSPVFDRPFSRKQALEKVETWLALSNIRIINETENHWQLLKELLREVAGGPNITTDAHLAALAIGYNATLVSCDADFVRFKRVRWEDPSQGQS